MIYANRQQMLQLFGHLVHNAVKYHQPELHPIIRVSAETHDDQFQIYIRDNGIGVAAEHQEKIFELFRRAPNGPIEKGTGMGLAICRKIMEKHEGNIELQSELNEGSTFIISLPRVSNSEKIPTLVKK